MSEFREAREADKIRRADDAGQRIDTISYNRNSADEDEELDEEYDYEDDEYEYADDEELTETEIDEVDGQFVIANELNNPDNYENSTEEGEYVIKTDFDPSSWDITNAVDSVVNFFEKDLQMKSVADAIKKADIDNKTEAVFKKVGAAKKKADNSENVIVRKTSRFLTVAIIFTIFMIISVGCVFVLFNSVDNSVEVDYYTSEPTCIISELREPINHTPSYGHWYYTEYDGYSTDHNYGYDFEYQFYDSIYISEENDKVNFFFNFMPEYMEVRVWDRERYETDANLDSNYELIKFYEDGSIEDETLNYSFDILDEDKVYCIYATYNNEFYENEFGEDGYYEGECYYPFVIERVDY